MIPQSISHGLIPLTKAELWEVFRMGQKTGAVEVLKELGLHTGHITVSQARKAYGRKFVSNAIKDGDIVPVKKGNRSMLSLSELYRLYGISETLRK